MCRFGVLSGDHRGEVENFGGVGIPSGKLQLATDGGHCLPQQFFGGGGGEYCLGVLRGKAHPPRRGSGLIDHGSALR
ncbi:Uncharacterised protein [Mycobacteroides abscessus subsp. abscessus]|nr:Uncharacterised protein [Mycobacteroides abscessus subsp. abscessus]